MKWFRCVRPARHILLVANFSQVEVSERDRRWVESLGKVQCPVCCCMCIGRDMDDAVETFVRHLERDH